MKWDVHQQECKGFLTRVDGSFTWKFGIWPIGMMKSSILGDPPSFFNSQSSIHHHSSSYHSCSMGHYIIVRPEQPVISQCMLTTWQLCIPRPEWLIYHYKYMGVPWTYCDGIFLLDFVRILWLIQLLRTHFEILPRKILQQCWCLISFGV